MAVIAMGAGVLLSWMWRFAPGGDVLAKARLCADALVPLAAGSLIVLWTAPKHRNVAPAVRRAWRLLAAATTAWWVSGALWQTMGRPMLSWADAVHALFFPLVLAGVLGFPAPSVDRDGRLRLWLDTAIVVLSGGSAVWYVALWPALQQEPHLRTLVASMFIPLGDLVVLFAACVALRRGIDGVSRRALAWVASALIVRFVGDLVYIWQSVVGGYADGGLADLTWLSACWMFAAGAIAQRRPQRVVIAIERADPRTSISLLPYAGVFAACGLLVATVHETWGARTSGVLVAAIGVTTLVLLRQFLATRENLRLLQAQAVREVAHAGQARFRSLVQNSSDVIAIIDARGVITFVTPSVERVLGYPAELVLGKTLASFVHPSDAPNAGLAIAGATADAGSTGPFRLKVRNADGDWRRVECMMTNLHDEPTIDGVVVTVRDVTDRAALEAKLLHQAFHDPLTGLANRVLFRDRVSNALERAAREPNGVVALFLDLDDFKTVNDSLGHREGDRLLSVVAERLLNATRGCDTVARLGGDEFAVLLENARSEADAITVAERIVAALKAPIALGGQDVQVGASVGIAQAQPEDGAEELLRNADVAMYRAKQRGKNTYEIFVPAMHAALVDRMELEADLRRAVNDGDCAEFRVYYQPIVALSGGDVTGVEALVRWRHPRRGLVPPLDFIPSAEATGLIVPLGRWVLREACAQAAQWQTQRPVDAPLTVTVNLSGRQLRHPRIVDDVREVLAETGLAPSALVLEITESVIIENTEESLATLHALKSLGIRLAVDDFGTGYSSLGYLQQFPIDILKIDKAFVDGVARGGSRAALARTIVALGDSLALHCVAEGIEEDAQRQHLQALGCAYGQGYLFARPLPASDVEAMVCGEPVTRDA